MKWPNMPHVTAVEGARSVSARLVNANRTWRGVIQGKPEQPELHRIVGLEHRVYKPPHNGLLLTDRLADRLKVKPGDTVRLEFLEGRRDSLDINVTGVVSEMLGMNAYIERRALNTLLREGNTVNQVTVAVDRGHDTELLNALKELPRVALAVSKSIMKQNIK